MDIITDYADILIGTLITAFFIGVLFAVAMYRLDNLDPMQRQMLTTRVGAFSEGMTLEHAMGMDTQNPFTIAQIMMLPVVDSQVNLRQQGPNSVNLPSTSRLVRVYQHPTFRAHGPSWRPGNNFPHPTENHIAPNVQLTLNYPQTSQTMNNRAATFSAANPQMQALLPNLMAQKSGGPAHLWRFNVLREGVTGSSSLMFFTEPMPENLIRLHNNS